MGEISEMKSKSKVLSKKIEIIKLLEDKNKCSNDDISKLISDKKNSYKKIHLTKCSKIIPNSKVFSYTNAKKNCDNNPNCVAIGNKYCDKTGFHLCSSFANEASKDCECVYEKHTKVPDSKGSTKEDI